MKINNDFKIKLKNISLTAYDGGETIKSLSEIMYLYWDLTVALKDGSKVEFQSGDMGSHHLLGFVDNLKLLINTKCEHTFSDNIKFSQIDTSSLLDSATFDSSFRCEKLEFADGKEFYNLTFKNPNGTAVCVDWLNGDEIDRVLGYFEKKLEELLK